MATDRLPIPKTIEVTLRRDNEAPQCPEVTRCLLSVEREPNPDLMEVVDSGLPSPLLNRETTVQLLRAEMLPAGHNCHRDYTIEANLISAGGPIAVGEGRIRATTINTLRVYIASGSVISNNTTTTTEAAPLSADPGTTTSTEITDHSDETRMTITTTVVISRDRWEVRLCGCIAPAEIFLPETPVHLLSARYRNSRTGEAVAIITWQDTNTTWHVLVERRGVQGAIQPFHLQFSAATDDLKVSAAISDNLQSLYIVESRRPGAEHRARYYHYTWGQYDGQWELFVQGLVPKPTDAISSTPYYVDRAGDVVGYWATEASTVVEQRTEDGTCNAPIRFPGESWTKSTDRYSAIWGGSWNIISGVYSAGASRRKGLSVNGGDVVAVDEQMVSNWNHVTYYDYYSFDSVWEGSSGSLPRAQQITLDSELHFNLIAGGQSLATVEDSGERVTFSGRYECEVEILPDPESPFGFGYFGQTRMYFDTYTNFSGSSWATVTPGGWVTRGTTGTELVGNDFSPVIEDFAAHTDAWEPSCPNMAGFFEGTRTTEVASSSSEVIYPIHIGAYHSTPCSFNAIDQESGDWYAGILIKATESSDPSWSVYCNGDDITDAVEACCGRPIEQLCGIYWRA